jgi:hypothetical protein
VTSRVFRVTNRGGAVIMSNPEDQLAAVKVPRLLAAEADTRLVSQNEYVMKRTRLGKVVGSYKPPLNPLALAVAFVLALTGVGSAFAVSPRLGDLDSFFWFFDKEGNDASIPRLIGDRAVVTRGEDWAFVAWRSTRGLCTSLVFPEHEGATSCGSPVVGSPPEEGILEHQIVGGAYQGRPDDDLWINGVAAANASGVEVELTDDRRLQAPVYDAPAALGLDLKFFLVRTRPPEGWPPKVGIPEIPVRAFSAYDARGRLLERFGPADAP